MKPSRLVILSALAVALARAEQPEPAPDAEHQRRRAEFNGRRVYEDFSRETIAEIPDVLLEQAIVDLVFERTSKVKGLTAQEVLAGLPSGFTAVYSTWVVKAEVENGGFNQLFFNSSGRFAQDAVAGFDRMGLPELARVVEFAIATNQKDAPRLEKLRAEGTLEAFSRSYDQRPYEPLDRAFYARSKTVSPARIAFIRAHPELFVTRPRPAR